MRPMNLDSSQRSSGESQSAVQDPETARAPKPDISFGRVPETNIHYFPGNTLEAGRRLLASQPSHAPIPVVGHAERAPGAVRRPVAALTAPVAAPSALASASASAPTVSIRVPRGRSMGVRHALDRAVARAEADLRRWMSDTPRAVAEIGAGAVVLTLVTLAWVAFLAVA